MTENKPLTLKEYFNSEKAVGQLQTYLGKDENTIRKFTTGVLMQVFANEKLKDCTNDSILTACIDAINLGLSVDNRNHAYLVPYGKKATLQIGWKGYVYKIKEKHPEADFQIGLVFEGDEFTDVETIDGMDTFRHKKVNPFCNDYNKLMGAYCYITYYAAGERKGKLTLMGKDEIKQIRTTAKSDTFWGKWWNEMVKKTVIRRACKTIFTGLVDDLDNADNDNFIFENDSAKPIKSAVVNKLSEKMQALTKVELPSQTEEIIEVEIINEPEVIEPEPIKQEKPKPIKKEAKVDDGELF